MILTKRVFLAAPFKQLLDQSQTMQTADQALLIQVMTLLEKNGLVVDNAHRREAWGQAMMTPDDCTQADFQAIAACDVLLAFPGQPASPGTHIELGWASAMGKPIVLLLEAEATYAYLVQGLKMVGDVTYLTYHDAASCLAVVSNWLLQWQNQRELVGTDAYI